MFFLGTSPLLKDCHMAWSGLYDAGLPVHQLNSAFDDILTILVLGTALR